MWGDMAIQIGDKKSWDMVWIITNEQPRSSKKTSGKKQRRITELTSNFEYTSCS